MAERLRLIVHSTNRSYNSEVILLLQSDFQLNSNSIGGHKCPTFSQLGEMAMSGSKRGGGRV